MACSYIVPTQIYFERGSAELSRSQVTKLSEWLNRSYESLPLYKGASIETGASGDIPSEAKALAKLRAVNTVRALRILLRTNLPIETFSHGYRSPRSQFGENNDFAAIHLYPDVEGLKLPKCHPAPPLAPSGDAKAPP
ncbi:MULTISPECIES: hypothetical protein [unclassified Variovorax]|uniref:hypothetical protein n=1 Tax=unclassified Variovorax TaxID=663243 RepID=UPI003F4552E0